MSTETYTTGSGKTTRPADTEHTSITTGPNMKANGSMITSTARALRPGSMAVDTRATTPRGRRTARVNILGRTAVISWGTGRTTKSMVLGCTSGAMVVSTRETG